MKNKEYLKQATYFGQLLQVRFSQGHEIDIWARAAGFAGVVAIGMALAPLTWRMIPLPIMSGTVQPSTVGPTGRGAPQLSISVLTESHLFGLPLSQPGGAINAPETTLNLNVRGIFALDSQHAIAIIGSAGGAEEPYKVGDTLPGGATVHEITADKVILERGGRFETLTLPKESLESQGVAPVASAMQPANQLGDIRNRLKANPSEIVGMNAVQPVMENGRLKGYRLADNPYMPALREAGVMPGDVVTRVNGIPVTEQARAAEVINQLSNAGQLNLEVERGGVTTTLSVNLGR